MMARSVPMDLIQAGATSSPGASSGIMLAGGPLPSGSISPVGLPFQPVVPGMSPPPAAVAAAGALTGSRCGPGAAKRTEVRFVSPVGMKVSWFAPTPDGRAGFASNYLTVRGTYNFLQAAVYRLKISDIPNRPGLELYPTLEVVPSNARTDTFLSHSAVPVAFTEEDFDQVTAGNFLVKVIYLPDPQFQELATAGTEEVVSTRLEPGVDPIGEAHRRGSILLVVRMGNINLEAPNTPPIDAPSPYMPKQAAAPASLPKGMMPGIGMPGPAGIGNAIGGGPNRLMLPPAGQPANPEGPLSTQSDPPVIEQMQYKVPMNGSGSPAQTTPPKTNTNSSKSSSWWPWGGGKS
jgi:hypothetical protein